MTVKEKILRGFQILGLVVSGIGLILFVCGNYETDLWLVHLLTFFMMFVCGLSITIAIEIRDQLLARAICLLTVLFAMVYKLFKRPLDFMRRCYQMKDPDYSWREMYYQLVERYNRVMYIEKYGESKEDTENNTATYTEDMYIVELNAEALQSK